MVGVLRRLSEGHLYLGVSRTLKLVFSVDAEFRTSFVSQRLELQQAPPICRGDPLHFLWDQLDGRRIPLSFQKWSNGRSMQLHTSQLHLVN